MRLPVLLVVLAGVAVYGVPKIIHNAGATTAQAASPCPTNLLLRKLPDSRFRPLLQASGIGLLVGRGTLDTQGWQEPVSAWGDDVPSNHPVADSTVVDAGYEIRWYSPAGDHDVAAFLVFPSPRVARRFVRQAISVRCVSRAVVLPVSEPAGARGIVWTNPDQAWEADVTFARGPAVYRIGVVPYGDPSALTLLRVAQRLACQVAAADCSKG